MDTPLTFSKFGFLAELGLDETNIGGYRAGEWIASGSDEILSNNPHDNQKVARTKCASLEDYEATIAAMEAEKEAWQTLPAPKRGEIVRQIGNELRKYKDALGSLVSLETGKIKAEGDGEV